MRRYYWKRAVRIVPKYCSVLAIICLAFLARKLWQPLLPAEAQCAA